MQQIFGSQRGLKSVEDFTEFEQRAAYFDGDPVLATKKGLNPLDRGSQVQAMSEFQKLLDFPPAPKLDIDVLLDPELASEAELRGQALFLGKAECGSCHTPPFYTDQLMHDLHVERFYEPTMINGRLASSQDTDMFAITFNPAMPVADAVAPTSEPAPCSVMNIAPCDRLSKSCDVRPGR